ncbi:MAG: NAD(P)/FAD-dependent oxidoreductase [Hyphomicrobiaceae bacterium]
MTNNPYVIIGAGPAGVIASETLRTADPATPVVIIGEESEAPYSRMAIPYLLAEDIEETGTHLRHGDGHFGKAGVEIRNDTVTAVQTGDKSVSLASGGSQSYSKLLVATGSHAIRPPIPGIDLAGVENCWTLDDARKIASKATAGSRVVLMGAGFIGCIVLEALAARKVNLTVVEMEDRMVPRMMDQTGGAMIKRWCESRGVTVLTSTRIEEIVENGDALSLKLSNGDTLEADLVVCAAGVMPNIAFLEGSGIETGTGVLVNDRMQTSDGHVYAAGDVAEGIDFSTGSHEIHAIQPTAADHGRTAALNMAGQDTQFQGSLSMNVLNTLGLITSSFGQWDGVPGGETAERADEDRFRYIRLSFQDDVLVGALALGLTQHVGVLRGLIQSKVKLGHWKDRLVANPLLVMEAYLARTQGSSFGI